MNKRPRTSKICPPKASTAIPTTPPSTSLEAYISNLFYLLVLQDDHHIFVSTYDKNWSRDVDEVDDGTPLTFTSFRTFLNTQRETVSNRQLVSQSFIVAPADALGWTGSVAYTHTFSGVKDDETIVGTVVSILKIEIRNGSRVVVAENFVMGF